MINKTYFEFGIVVHWRNIFAVDYIPRIVVISIAHLSVSDPLGGFRPPPSTFRIGVGIRWCGEIVPFDARRIARSWPIFT